VTAYMATPYHNPEDYIPESLRREKLKIYVTVWRIHLNRSNEILSTLIQIIFSRGSATRS